MTIRTFPVFYYGYTVTENNFWIDIDEGSGEISAQLNVGDYSLSEITVEIQRALNDVGDNTYTVSVDRDSRIITIASSAPFDILASSGTHSGAGFYQDMGFNSNDKTGLSSYDGDEAAGSEYIPQFIPQDYVDFEDFEDSVDATVNEASGGELQIVTFGNRNFMEMNITLATNIRQGKDSPIRDNETGVEDLRDLLRFMKTKAIFEFMKSESDRSTFDKIILEKTRTSKTGTGFKLMELKKLKEHFETGKITFRRKS